MSTIYADEGVDIHILEDLASLVKEGHVDAWDISEQAKSYVEALEKIPAAKQEENSENIGLLHEIEGLKN